MNGYKHYANLMQINKIKEKMAYFTFLIAENGLQIYELTKCQRPCRALPEEIESRIYFV